LFAGRRNKMKVDQSDFEDAKDKIYMGPERRSMIMHDDERKATAYHESGHAIVASSLPFTDPVHKVTIMPRGRALGLTWQLPERDRISMYEDQMLNQISILFGGRIAEDLFIGRVSTGASNDFERATSIARDMVTRYGMSKKMGPMVYAENEGEVFLGRSVTNTKNISEATMQAVDAEVRRIIDEQYAIAYKILDDNRDKMHTMSKALLDWETIDADQVKEIMDGKQPSLPKDYSYNVKTQAQLDEEEAERVKAEEAKAALLNGEEPPAEVIRSLTEKVKAKTEKEEDAKADQPTEEKSVKASDEAVKSDEPAENGQKDDQSADKSNKS
jgi:cell division protease FtsH